jgi:hypothetical protein
MRWNAVQHAFGADVFIDVGPMDPVTVPNQAPIRALSWRRVRQPPRPRERHADHASIDQVGRDRFVGDVDAIDSRFNADRSAHAMPQ